VIDSLRNHIVHLGLISDGAEMEATHAQDGTFKAGITQRTFLRNEAAHGGFVAGFKCGGGLRSWDHGGHSCYRGPF
jgi:hypothetical protein